MQGGGGKKAESETLMMLLCRFRAATVFTANVCQPAVAVPILLTINIWALPELEVESIIAQIPEGSQPSREVLNCTGRWEGVFLRLR